MAGAYSGAARGLEFGLVFGNRLSQQSRQNAREDELDAEQKAERQRLLDKEAKQEGRQMAGLTADFAGKQAVKARSSAEAAYRADPEMKKAATRDIIDRELASADTFSDEETQAYGEILKKDVTGYLTRTGQTIAELQSGKRDWNSFSGAELGSAIARMTGLSLAEFVAQGEQASPARQKISAAEDAVKAGDFDTAGSIAGYFFKKEAERAGIGEESPHGTRTGADVVGFLPSRRPGYVVPDLKISVRHSKHGDGSYLAPPTKNRSSDPNDTVVDIPQKAIIERVGQMGHLEAIINGDQDLRAKLALYMQSPDYQKDEAIRGDVRTRIAAAGRKVGDSLDTEKTRSEIDKNKSVSELNRARAKGVGTKGAGGKLGSDPELVEYLKTNLYGNVKDNAERTRLAIAERDRMKKTLQKSGSLTEFSTKLVLELMKPDQYGRKQFKTNDEAVKEAQRIAKQFFPDQKEAAAPTAEFTEGEEYEDANGNRAIYQNGEFVPAAVEE